MKPLMSKMTLMKGYDQNLEISPEQTAELQKCVLDLNTVKTLNTKNFGERPTAIIFLN